MSVRITECGKVFTEFSPTNFVPSLLTDSLATRALSAHRPGLVLGSPEGNFRLSEWAMLRIASYLRMSLLSHFRFLAFTLIIRDSCGSLRQVSVLKPFQDVNLRCTSLPWPRGSRCGDHTSSRWRIVQAPSGIVKTGGWIIIPTQILWITEIRNAAWEMLLDCVAAREMIVASRTPVGCLQILIFGEICKKIW